MHVHHIIQEGSEMDIDHLGLVNPEGSQRYCVRWLLVYVVCGQLIRTSG